MKRTAAAMTEYDVIVIGGGASGLFAAAVLSEAGKRVLIVEPNRFLGRKLRITGKGRCNLTNNCSPDEVLKNVLRNPRFLYSSLNRFPPKLIMEWFSQRGLQLKTERGRRVFPVSDKASDVADTLANICSSHRVTVFRSKVTDIISDGGQVRGVECKEGNFYADAVICACGGMSYPGTGSDGNGYSLAMKLGHTVIKPQPSLVPVELSEGFCTQLDGLALKNITLSLYDIDKSKKPLYSELGELSFTPYGIGGPLGISASCYMSADRLSCKGYKLYIDLKPGLDEKMLENRIIRDIKSEPAITVDKLFRKLMPLKLSEVVCELLKLDKQSFARNISREKRQEIIKTLKRFELTPTGLRPFEEAIITHGGVSVKEISPSTMESKLVKGLYFTGEIIDVDAFTGGYNLTIAFSTAYTAASDILTEKDVE